MHDTQDAQLTSDAQLRSCLARRCSLVMDDSRCSACGGFGRDARSVMDPVGEEEVEDDDDDSGDGDGSAMCLVVVLAGDALPDRRWCRLQLGEDRRVVRWRGSARR
ncbi:hypothetical protein Dimus_013234, partial [Dionaea muscipula]